MNANRFGFILDQMGPGRHDVEMQARVSTRTSTVDGDNTENASSVYSNAYIGHGSITVEEVRLEKDADITF